MKYEQFLKQVQGLAQLNSRKEAETVTAATLQTIAERIVGNESSQLAAQLPKEFGQYLRGHEGEDGHHFTLEEFYRRVSEKSGIDPVSVAPQVRVVFMVLNEAVTPGEFADVKANFSPDYSELFATPGKA